MRRTVIRGLVAVAALTVLGAMLVGFFNKPGTPVPVLMYHHFMKQGPSQADTVVSAQMFDQQLQALQQGGYTTITPKQLIDYVYNQKPLPEKPVMITMDDGYTSNLTIAAPILEQYGMTATVFTIGINVGETAYPHSGVELDPPRFSWEEAQPWIENGTIVVQSHTYDMHQRIDYGFSGRDGVLPLEGERDEDYRMALAQDFEQAKEGLTAGAGVEMQALAFPFGLNSPEAVEELEKLGVKVTFTTLGGCDRAIPGEGESIQLMPRWGIHDAVTGEDLLNGLAKMEKS